MNLVKLNKFAYKAVCILAICFFVLMSVAFVPMHLYLRSGISLAFAIVAGFRFKREATLKAWIITVVLIAIGVALIDLDPVEQDSSSRISEVVK